MKEMLGVLRDEVSSLFAVHRRAAAMLLFLPILYLLLFGGLFGFVGMILGVPTFAVIYYLVDMTINQKLKAKGLPTSSVYYDPESYVDEKGQYVPGDPDAPRDGSLTPSGADDTPADPKESQEKEAEPDKPET